MWFFAILLVLVMGAIAMVAAGRGTPLAPTYDDRPDVSVPAGTLRGDDLRRVRFSLAFRGYRMSEVDALLDRVAAQLAADRADMADGADGTDGVGEVNGERGARHEP